MPGDDTPVAGELVDELQTATVEREWVDTWAQHWGFVAPVSNLDAQALAAEADPQHEGGSAVQDGIGHQFAGEQLGYLEIVAAQRAEREITNEPARTGHTRPVRR